MKTTNSDGSITWTTKYGYSTTTTAVVLAENATRIALDNLASSLRFAVMASNMKAGR